MPKVRGYKSWISHNKAALEQGMRKHINSVTKPELVAYLRKVAEQLVAAIDGNTFSIPVYTGNLKDATGVGVYVDGVMSAFMPTKTAVKKQAMKGRPYIFGSEFLAASLREASTTFSTGVWLVIFSAVPYAYKINTEGSPKGRGKGYWDAIVNDVIANLKPLDKL